MTSCPASRNSGINRRPIAPLAPAMKTLIDYTVASRSWAVS
jgi:hypothetical protein